MLKTSSKAGRFHPHRSASRCRLLSSVGIAAIAFVAVLASTHKAKAQSFQGTPQVVTGSAIVTTPNANSTSVTVASPTSIIRWTPTNAAINDVIQFQNAGTTASFQPAVGITIPSYTVLNQIISPSTTDIIRFDGNITSTAAGNIWFYTPGGMIIGETAAFNVGSLVLSTSNIPQASLFVGQNGKIAFTGVQNPNSAIDIRPGARIDTRSFGSNYVALVAPRIIQAGQIGSIAAGGGNIDQSTVLLAAEQAEITFSANNLFDIKVTAGSADANGIVHTGTTTAPAPTATNTGGSIYMVAVPKNQAMTMLLSGSIGHEANSANFTTEGSIILGAGHNIAPADPFGIINSFTPVPTAGTANILLAPSNLIVTDRLRAAATGSISNSLVGGNASFAKDVVLSAPQDVTLSAENGRQVSFGRDLTLNAGIIGQNVGDVIRAGNVSLTAIGAASRLSVTGQTTLNASASMPGYLSGSATAGNAAVTATGGGALVLGDLTVLTDVLTGFGIDNVAPTAAGTAAVAGSTTVTVDATSSLSAANLTILATAQGGGALGTGAGGSATAGSARLSNSGTITLSRDLSVDVSAFGGAAGLGSNGGNATSGAIQLLNRGQMRVIGGSDFGLATSGGSAGDGGYPGLAQNSGGATISSAGAGANLSFGTSQFSPIPQSVSVDGTSESGQPGDVQAAVRGANISILAVDGGQISSSAAIAVNASARFSDTQAPRFPLGVTTGQGGTIEIGADRGGIFTLGALIATSNAFAGYAGTGPLRIGGAPIGGQITLYARDGGSAAFGDGVTLNASAGATLSGSIGGRGGNITIFAEGGTVDLGANAMISSGGITDGGTITPSLGQGGSILVETRASPFAQQSSITMGTGSFLSEGAVPVSDGDGSAKVIFGGGSAAGGAVTFNVNSGQFSAAQLTVGSRGMGSDSASADVVSPQFAAGSGTGGQATFNINGGSATIGALTIESSGEGGNGLDGFNDPTLGVRQAGLAGNGLGGDARLTVSGGSLRVGALSVLSSGKGGGGGNNPIGTVGVSGTGTGGSANIIVTGGTLTGIGTGGVSELTVAASGTGGSSSSVFFDAFSEGGSGRGGTATVLQQGGTINVAALSVSAGAEGGIGKGNSTKTAGSGGSASGGSAALAIEGGQFNAQSIDLSASGIGAVGGTAGSFTTVCNPICDTVFTPGTGAGGMGGGGTGGSASVKFGIDPTIASLTIDVSGVGAAGGNGAVGGAGGSGIGGTGSNGALLTVASDTLSVTGVTQILANGVGGVGGNGTAGKGGAGGDAVAGAAGIRTIGDGTLFDARDLTLSASAIGGLGGIGSAVPAVATAGADGGSATGGSVTIDVGAGSKVTTSGQVQLRANANGVDGRRGIDGGAQGDGGSGGEALAGSVRMTAPDGNFVMNGTPLIASATATGGNGGIGGSSFVSGSGLGGGGAGGNATGGIVDVTVQSTALGFVANISTDAIGGAGGDGSVGGNGGNASAVAPGVSGSFLTFLAGTNSAAQTLISSRAFGGNGGDSDRGIGSSGGAAIAGVAQLQLRNEGTILTATALSVYSDAFGGAGGSGAAGAAGGAGGQARGGQSRIGLSERASATIEIGQALSSLATGGAGGRGGDGTLSTLTGGAGGRGGDGAAGVIDIEANSAQLTLNSFVATTTGTGGAGGAGGDGSDATNPFSAAATGSSGASGSTFGANGSAGGAGAAGAAGNAGGRGGDGGQAGQGIGGSVRIASINTRLTAGNVTANSNGAGGIGGLGGNGGKGGSGQQGGTGGTGGSGAVGSPGLLAFPPIFAGTPGGRGGDGGRGGTGGVGGTGGDGGIGGNAGVSGVGEGGTILFESLGGQFVSTAINATTRGTGGALAFGGSGGLGGAQGEGGNGGGGGLAGIGGNGSPIGLAGQQGLLGLAGSGGTAAGAGQPGTAGGLSLGDGVGGAITIRASQGGSLTTGQADLLTAALTGQGDPQGLGGTIIISNDRSGGDAGSLTFESLTLTATGAAGFGRFGDGIVVDAIDAPIIVNRSATLSSNTPIRFSAFADGQFRVTDDLTANADAITVAHSGRGLAPTISASNVTLNAVQDILAGVGTFIDATNSLSVTTTFGDLAVARIGSVNDTTLNAGRSIVGLDNLEVGDDLRITAGGSITFSSVATSGLGFDNEAGSTEEGSHIFVNAQSNVRLDRVNAAGSAGILGLSITGTDWTAGEDISVSTPGALAITGLVQTGDDLSLSAGNILLGTGLSTGTARDDRSMRLNSVGQYIIDSSATDRSNIDLVAFDIETGNLSTNAGTVLLSGVGSFTTGLITVSDDFTIDTSAALTLGGVSAGDDIDIKITQVSRFGRLIARGTAGADNDANGSNIGIESSSSVFVDHAEAQDNFSARTNGFATGPDSITTGGAVDIAVANGDIDAGVIRAGGTITLTNTGLGSISGTSLTTGGDLNIVGRGTIGIDFARADGGYVPLGTVRASASGVIFVASRDGDVGLGDAIAASHIGVIGNSVIGRGTWNAAADVFVQSATTANLNVLTAGDDVQIAAPGGILLSSATASGAGPDTQSLESYKFTDNLDFLRIIPETNAGSDIILLSNAAPTIGSITATNLTADDDVIAITNGNLTIRGLAQTINRNNANPVSSVGLGAALLDVTGVSAATDLVVISTGDANVGTSRAGRNIAVTAGGSLGFQSLDARGGIGLGAQRDVTGGSLTADRDIGINAARISVGSSLAGGALDYRSTNGALSTGNVTAASIALTSGTDLRTANLVSTAGNIDLNAQGAINTGDITALTGSLSIVNTLGTITTGLITIGNDFTLSTASDLVLGGVTVGDDIRITTSGTAVLGTLDAGKQISGTDTESDGRNIVLNVAGALSVAHAEARDDFVATSGSFATGLNTIITGGNIDISSPGNIDLGNSQAGGFIRANAGGLLAFNTIQSGNFTRLTAAQTVTGEQAVSDADIGISAGGNVTVNFATANGTYTNPTTGAATDGNIFIRVADANFTPPPPGNVTLTNATARNMIGIAALDVGGSGSWAAGEDIRVISSGVVTLANITAGNDIAVTAPGTITIANATTTGLGTDTRVISFAPSPIFSVQTAPGDGSDIELTSTGAGLVAGTLTANQDLTVTTFANGGLGTAIAGGQIDVAGGSITFASTQSGGITNLTATTNITGGQSTSGDAFTATSDGGLSLSSVSAVNLANIRVDTGVLSLGTVGSAGDILIRNFGTGLTEVTASATATGDILVEAGGDVSVAQATARGTYVDPNGLGRLGTVYILADGNVSIGAASALTMLGIRGANVTGTGLWTAGEDILAASLGTATLVAASAGDDIDIVAPGGITLTNGTARADARDDRSLQFVPPLSAGLPGQFQIAISPADGSDIRLAAAGGGIMSTGLTAGDDISLTALGTVAVAGLAQSRGVGTTAGASNIAVTAGTATLANSNAATNLTVTTTGNFALGNALAGSQISGVSSGGSGTYQNLTSGTGTALQAATGVSGSNITAGTVIDITNLTSGAISVANLTAAAGSVSVVNPRDASAGFAAGPVVGRTVTTGALSASTDILVQGKGTVTIQSASAGNDVLASSALDLNAGNITAGRDLATISGASSQLGNLVAGRDVGAISAAGFVPGTTTVERPDLIRNVTIASATAGDDIAVSALGILLTGNLRTTGLGQGGTAIPTPTGFVGGFADSPGSSIFARGAQGVSVGQVDSRGNVQLLNVARAFGGATFGTGSGGLTAGAVTAVAPVTITSNGSDAALSTVSGSQILITSGSRVSADALTTTAGNLIVTAPGGIAIARTNLIGGGTLTAANGPVTVSADLRSTQLVNVTGTSLTLRSVADMNLGTVQATSGEAVINAGGSANLSGPTSVQTSLDVTAAGSISIASSASGGTIALRSSDIVISPTAQVGALGRTTQLSLTNTGTRQTQIGGAGGTGYNLSATEIARLTANMITINAPVIGGPASIALNSARAPDVLVGSFTLSGGSNIGPQGAFTINTAGKVRVTGQVSFTGLNDSQRFVIRGDEAIEVLDAGAIELNGANGLAGTLDLTSHNIVAASSSALADFAAASNLKAISERAGNNDGRIDDGGYLQSGAIRATLLGSTFIVQNTGARTGIPRIPSDFDARRGLSVGTGGIQIIGGGPTARIAINGRQVSAAGGFTTGLKFIPLVGISDQLGNSVGTLFDIDSTINGCSILRPASCQVDFNQLKIIADTINDARAKDKAAGNGQLLQFGLIELKDVEKLGYNPIIDDPVTGAGNDDLWAIDDETVQSSAPPSPTP